MKNQEVKFSIEDITVSGDNVEVFYFINDGELQEANLSYQALKDCAIAFELNAWQNDYCNGVAVQESGLLDIDTYMVEHLEEVVKYYLSLTYNPLEAISNALEFLIAGFGGRKEVA